MSAYGAIPRPQTLSGPKPSTIWPCTPKPYSNPRFAANHLTLHHLTLSTALDLNANGPRLIDYLRNIFTLDVNAGRTYPQESIDGEGAFEAYFFAADVLVGIIGVESEGPLPPEGTEVGGSVTQAAAARPWEECVAGFYYVKPNYPGRSSHICNAGFIVSPTYRGAGYGKVLGRSYLHYGKQLGYRASVFNLVYVNNIASVKIWESLDFEKVGRIPQAGRLRQADGNGEEYVDAWVFYKDFSKEVNT